MRRFAAASAFTVRSPSDGGQSTKTYGKRSSVPASRSRSSVPCSAPSGSSTCAAARSGCDGHEGQVGHGGLDHDLVQRPAVEQVVRARRELLRPESEARGRVGLRVEVDQEHGRARLGDARGHVDRRGRLADAALLVCKGVDAGAHGRDRTRTSGRVVAIPGRRGNRSGVGRDLREQRPDAGSGPPRRSRRRRRRPCAAACKTLVDVGRRRPEQHVAAGADERQAQLRRDRRRRERPGQGAGRTPRGPPRGRTARSGRGRPEHAAPSGLDGTGAGRRISTRWPRAGHRDAGRQARCGMPGLPPPEPTSTCRGRREPAHERQRP